MIRQFYCLLRLPQPTWTPSRGVQAAGEPGPVAGLKYNQMSSRAEVIRVASTRASRVHEDWIKILTWVSIFITLISIVIAAVYQFTKYKEAVALATERVDVSDVKKKVQKLTE